MRTVPFMTYFLCYVVSSKIDIRAWRAYNGDMVWELDGTPFLWEGVRIEMTRVSDETIAGVIPMHNHAADSLELHLIVSGTGQIRTQGRTLTLRAGDIFLTVGGEAHEQDSDVREPMQELCIYAAFRRADRLGEAAKTLLSNAFLPGARMRICSSRRGGWSASLPRAVRDTFRRCTVVFR